MLTYSALPWRSPGLAGSFIRWEHRAHGAVAAALDSCSALHVQNAGKVPPHPCSITAGDQGWECRRAGLWAVIWGFRKSGPSNPALRDRQVREKLRLRKIMRAEFHCYSLAGNHEVGSKIIRSNCSTAKATRNPRPQVPHPHIL